MVGHEPRLGLEFCQSLIEPSRAEPAHHYLSSPLWLISRGDVPDRDFFITRMHRYFDHNVGGQSMRAGGATFLAEHGVPPSLIQLMGCWSSSDARLPYIHTKKPCPHPSTPLFGQQTLMSYFRNILFLLFYLITFFFLSSLTKNKKNQLSAPLLSANLSSFKKKTNIS
jgi:hypothetical protein